MINSAIGIGETLDKSQCLTGHTFAVVPSDHFKWQVGLSLEKFERFGKVTSCNAIVKCSLMIEAALT